MSSNRSALRTSRFWTAAVAIGTLVSAILGLIQLIVQLLR
jgi:hypothetical protein